MGASAAKYGIIYMGVSGPSLLIESTNSMILYAKYVSGNILDYHKPVTCMSITNYFQKLNPKSIKKTKKK